MYALASLAEKHAITSLAKGPVTICARKSYSACVASLCRSCPRCCKPTLANVIASLATDNNNACQKTVPGLCRR